MARILSALIGLLVVIPTAAMAQARQPAAEIFGGYSFLSAGLDDFPRQDSHGLQASVTANLNRWFGIVADVGVQFNTATDLGPGFAGLVAKTNVREYLVGPRFTARSDRVAIFAHGLFGIATGDAGETFSGFSDSGLMLGGGGGVDIRVHRRAAIRAQFDRFGAFVDIAEVTSRFALGLVLRLGGS